MSARSPGVSRSPFLVAGCSQEGGATDAPSSISEVSSSTTTLRNSVQNMITGLTGELQVVSPDRNAIKSATFVSSTNAGGKVFSIPKMIPIFMLLISVSSTVAPVDRR
jgi:hypothetical protein